MPLLDVDARLQLLIVGAQQFDTPGNLQIFFEQCLALVVEPVDLGLNRRRGLVVFLLERQRPVERIRRHGRGQADKP